jgi:TniQ
MHYLPTPFPDEHIASLIARSAENQGRPPFLLSGLAAGKYRRYSPPRFVTSAAALSRDLTGGEYDKKSLIRRFCIYPFFAPFFNAQARVRHLRWALQYDNRGTSLSRSGGRPRSPVTLRLCPACVEEEKYGRVKQPYYHREHQLPGLDFCLRHHLQLREVGSHFNDIHLHSARVAVDKADADALSEAKVNLPPNLAAFLEESIEFLFSRDCLRNRWPDWRKLYVECLTGTNPTMIVAKIDALMDKIDALMDKIEPDARAMLPKAFGPLGWLRAYSKRFLTINGTNLPPIAHILIMYGLGLPIREALQYATDGFWRCPLKVCSSFGQLSLTKIVRRTNLHVKCSACGCTFTIPRSTPLGTIPPLVNVLTFGPRISERLLLMRKDGTSIEVIAKNTGLTEGKVYSFMQDLGMSPKSP